MKKTATINGSGQLTKSEPSLFGLDRLQGLEDELALLPVGWGSDGKAPMLAGWPDHPGFTVRELQGIHSIRSVGARTGLLTGPLLCFDFDGESSLHHGLDPSSVGSWQVHRDNDQHRLKVLFRPTLEQLSRLPDGEFQGKTITAPAADGRKGEALEVFFHGRRQVIVLGDHPSSGGRYVWPRGKGPEALTAPPETWWVHALEIAAACRQGSVRPRSNRHNTRRLNPCPICGWGSPDSVDNDQGFTWVSVEVAMNLCSQSIGVM